MPFGTPELAIALVATLFLFSGRIILRATGRSVHEISGIRPLTFQRTSDIVAGLVIVGAWLVTFLFLAHR